MSDRPWVLVTDHGDELNRTSLATVRALAGGGYRPAVTVAGRRSIAGASRFTERIVPTPTLKEGGYEEAVRLEVASRPYLTVLPTSDKAMLALDLPGADLLDKAALADRARRVGIEVPPTEVFAVREDLLARAGDLEYPVVVKPVIPGRAAFRVDAPQELDELTPRDRALIVQPYLPGPVSALGGVVRDGRLVAAVHQVSVRTWPPDCGGASAAVTVEPDPELEASILALLGDHEGIFMAQFVDGRLIDLNPRVYGSLPLAVEAGVNLAAIWCDLLSGRRVEPSRARPGVRYRWTEGDLRSVARTLRQGSTSFGRALASLLPAAGVAHSMELFRDPRPSLLRVRRGISDRSRRAVTRFRRTEAGRDNGHRP